MGKKDVDVLHMLRCVSNDARWTDQMNKHVDALFEQVMPGRYALEKRFQGPIVVCYCSGFHYTDKASLWSSCGWRDWEQENETCILYSSTAVSRVSSTAPQHARANAVMRAHPFPRQPGIGDGANLKSPSAKTHSKRVHAPFDGHAVVEDLQLVLPQVPPQDQKHPDVVEHAPAQRERERERERHSE